MREEKVGGGERQHREREREATRRLNVFAQRLIERSETFADCLEQCDRNRYTVREARYVPLCLLNKY